MSNGKPVLPITEPAEPAQHAQPEITQKDIFGPKYLVGLLPLDDEVDKLPYYNGDIYAGIDGRAKSQCAIDWQPETADLPYLARIRRSCTAFPELAHLASWMEVSTAVSRYKYLRRNPEERRDRAKRVHVCRIDLNKGKDLEKVHYTTIDDLKTALSAEKTINDTSDARVYVVEDLSRDVIEAFGSTFNIDPHLFRSQINDYMWNSLTGDAVELRHLDVIGRQRSFCTLQYLRPRYYPDDASFEKAIRNAADFNVLRQLDSDRSRKGHKNSKGAAATLMRAKASIWIRPDKPAEKKPADKKPSGGEPGDEKTDDGKPDGETPHNDKPRKNGIVAILLIDPTVKAERSGYPLWGGYSSFRNWSGEGATEPAPPRTSLYDDVVHWMGSLTDSDIDEIPKEPKTCALPALWLIVSDWHHVIKYVTTQLGQIEWEIEEPTLRRDASTVETTLKKLHPWRRNATLYRAMVAQTIDSIFSKEIQHQCRESSIPPECGLSALYRDFQIVLQDIDTIQSRVERIVSVAAALLSIEDNRRAMDQNHYVARLTYLATIFIPLSFVSGFFSMEPDVTALRQTFWIFFVVAVPLTLSAILVADWKHTKGKIRGWWWYLTHGFKHRVD